jgi:hypothetical protein
MTYQKPESAPSSEYRGVVLPEGMTRACLDSVARIINRHQLDDNDDLDSECAVKVFLAVQEHRA